MESKTTVSTSGQWVNWILFAWMIAMVLAPEFAFAAPWDDAIDGIIDSINSGTARGLAILAVMGLGIAGLVGKLSWKWAGGIIGGIVFIFGAAAIVDLAIDWVA